VARIEREGIWVEGTIVAAGRDPRNDGAAYVRYEYLVDGRTYGRQITLGLRGLRLLNADMRLRVRYLAGTPQLSWPAGYEPKAPAVWIFGFPLAILPGLALALAFAIARQKQLLAEGRVTA
jgi:hypothetical protein